MTARVSSQATLVLAGVESSVRATSQSLLVLWGVDSSARVSSQALLMLGRLMPRRVIGITD